MLLMLLLLLLLLLMLLLLLVVMEVMVVHLLLLIGHCWNDGRSAHHCQGTDVEFIIAKTGRMRLKLLS